MLLDFVSQVTANVFYLAIETIFQLFIWIFLKWTKITINQHLCMLVIKVYHICLSIINDEWHKKCIRWRLTIIIGIVQGKIILLFFLKLFDDCDSHHELCEFWCKHIIGWTILQSYYMPIQQKRHTFIGSYSSLCQCFKTYVKFES